MMLTSDQLAVVESKAQKILCSSGPGSGKSRVLVERIKHLIARGVNPNRIVVLSFTVAASAVLQERLGEIKLQCNSTIHSWLFSLLREHGNLIGLPSNLSVVDDDESKSLLSESLEEVAYKGTLREVESEVAKGPAPRPNPMTKAQIACEAFFQRLRADGILTFDMIEHLGLRLLLAMRSKGISLDVDHLLFDEAQDGTALEWSILDAANVPNFFAVGDADQRLYSWRGSCDEFEKRIANR